MNNITTIGPTNITTLYVDTIAITNETTGTITIATTDVWPT